MVGYVLSLLFFFLSLLSIYNDGHNNPHICCHVLLFSGRIRGHLRPSTPTAVAVNGRKVAFAWCGIRFIVSFTVIQDNKYNLHTHTHTLGTCLLSMLTLRNVHGEHAPSPSQPTNISHLSPKPRDFERFQFQCEVESRRLVSGIGFF